MASFQDPTQTGFPTGPAEHMEISWEMFGEVCRALALKVARDFDPEIVVGIAKSGVIPGAVIASILRRDFYSLTITRKEGGELVRERPAILSAAPLQCQGKRVLLVDETTSSGDTLRMGLAAIRDTRPREVRTATSFSRPGGFQPDYVAMQTVATLIFPWDRIIFDGEDLVVNPRYRGVIEQ